MSLRNSLNLINTILKYLKINNSDNNEIISLIKECIEEIELSNGFNYIYKKYDYKLSFLNHPSYNKYLEDCESYYLVCITLGIEVERKIKYLSKTNVSKMVVMDATASAVLEEMADQYEKSLEGDLKYRFCPGYSKTSVDDIKIIYKELKADKIGIEILDSCMIIPQKSMIGIVGIKK